MITAFLYFFQEKLLFFPTELEQDYQFQFNYNFEELNIETDDGAKLNAIHFKVKNPKGVILYFHGNAGDLQRWGTISEFFVEKQYDVLVMDYRTFGKSTGKLSEMAFYNDADVFYKYIKDNYNEADISLYGRSLGTGIATYLASKNAPKQLILETPYYSILDVAKHRFPIFPVEKLLKYKFLSFEFIQNVNCSTTIFHGTSDQVVPYASAKKLYEVSLKERTTFISIEGGTHNNLINFEAYHNQLKKVLP